MSLIQTSFGFASTAADVAAGVDLTGRRVIVTGVEATRRWACDGITANALMPGAVYTNLQRYTGGKGSGRTPADQFKSVQQGAATSVLLVVSSLLEGVGGRYFVDCNEAEIVDCRTGNLGGVARYALDPANAERLWTVSEQLLNRQPTSP